MPSPAPSPSQALQDPFPSLCQRLAASDRRAFEELFRLLRADLLRYVGSIVRDDVVAHDLVQDVFVALWGLRETLDPSQPLRPYVYRMARNRAYRHLRDERTHAAKHDLIRDAAASQRPQEPRTAADLDADRLSGFLDAWIAALPDRQREALMLSRFHQLSFREIAAVMGVSPRTVNNHIVRALGQLRDRIQAFEPTLLAP